MCSAPFIYIVVLTAAFNVGPLCGSVSIQGNTRAVISNDKDEEFTVEGTKGSIQLPAGKYYINQWSLERLDQNGDIWKLRGRSITDKSVFNVTEGMEADLAIGEPITSSLTVRKEDDVLYFGHSFKGRLGEDIEIAKNQVRADPPQLLIRNEDGSYQEAINFKYG